MTRPLLAGDIVGLRSASDAQPSPDGRRIAYVVTELDVSADVSRSSVWCIDAQGGRPSRLSQDASQPRWSPDGRSLAFVSARECGSQIWRLEIDRPGEPRRLTDVPGGVTGPPVWSPDGGRIACTARVASADAGAPRVIRRLRYRRLVLAYS